MQNRLIVSLLTAVTLLSSHAASDSTPTLPIPQSAPCVGNECQATTAGAVVDEPRSSQTKASEAPSRSPSANQPRIFDELVVTSTADPPSLSDELAIEQARAREQMLLRELAIQKAKVQELQQKVLASEEKPTPRNSRMVQVFFATDRKRTNVTKLDRYFGAQPARDLTFGTCDVLVPQDHRMGHLERPLVLAKIQLSRETDARHVVLKSITPVQDVEFFRQLSDRVQQSRRQEAFIFVHGFNVTFAEAARRTAQIAYDLAFDGAPILYSWPSHGAQRHYVADEDAVEDTVPRLEMFLNRVAIEGRVNAVYLIGHSMGNRALAKALERIYLRSNGAPSFVYRQLMLTAPDIRASSMQDLAIALTKMATRVTLYASDNDKALKLSRQINNYPRAGQAGDHLLLIDGIDTIDVTAVDTEFVGHFYYAGNRSVLADIFQSIRCAEHPRDRFSLQPRERDGKTYWVFVP